jgi:hypothetical protein
MRCHLTIEDSSLWIGSVDGYEAALGLVEVEMTKTAKLTSTMKQAVPAT